MKNGKIIRFLAVLAVILAVVVVINRRRQASSPQLENLPPVPAQNQPDLTPGQGVGGTNQDDPSSSLGFRVDSIKEIANNGVKDMDWHFGKNLIAFGRMSPVDYYYDVYVMNPDGSGEKCLTCGPSGAPQKHNGNQAWHPSGDYLVFTGQRDNAPRQADQYAIPGSGLYNDLWLVDSQGKNFFRLTDYEGLDPARAVIHPQFSHDGTKLIWAERVSRGQALGGGWVMKLAEFQEASGRPALGNIRELQPGRCGRDCFYETHGFSKDDKKIIFSANADGQVAYAADIHVYDLATGRLENLTNSPDTWDEHAHFSPNQEYVAWMSSIGYPQDWNAVKQGEHFKYLKTELWIMKADGSGKQKLTSFNDPSYYLYQGGKAIVSDSAFGPDGNSIVFLVAYETGRGRSNSRIFMMSLKPPQ